MLLAQWGLVDQLAGDPAVWLCHQCADCSERCPRDAKPGDVLQGLRAAVIRALAFPGFAGSLVGNARVHLADLGPGCPGCSGSSLLMAMGLFPVSADAAGRRTPTTRSCRTG